MRRLRRLIEKRSLRWSERICVIEGPDLVDAALAHGAEFEAIYVDAALMVPSALAALVERAGRGGVRIFGLAPGVLEGVADARTPQPVLGAIRLPLSEVTNIEVAGLTLVLHDLRDPGNVGTIIRSADASGATAVVVTGQSVDPFNPKVLRATAGSIFRVAVAVCDLSEALGHFSGGGARVVGTAVHGGTALRRVDFGSPTVVVIGNEATGLNRETLDRCDETLSIPMAGQCESLNAAVAASLIAFEALAQRSDLLVSAPRPSLEGL